MRINRFASFQTRRSVVDLLAVAFICTSLPAYLHGQEQNILHEGSPVRMRLNRTVSSANATQGEYVDFETLDDVALGNAVIVPKGSSAIGTITEAVPKRRMGRGGKLNINIDYLRLPSGDNPKRA